MDYCCGIIHAEGSYERILLRVAELEGIQLRKATPAEKKMMPAN
jgi:hypothetical protein